MSASLPIPVRRTGLVLLGLLLVLGSFVTAGPRAALLMLVGLGLGLVLEGLRFGFAGPWRVMITERDGRGLLAQFVAIGLAALVAFPLLANFPDELSGAHAPVGFAMIAAAFVFGIMMQIVLGCGSGTLVNAGSGNLLAFVALFGFIAGSFFGTLHLPWWAGLGSLPVYTMQGIFGEGAGLGVTLAGLAGLGAVVYMKAAPDKRRIPKRLWVAALLIAVFASLNLVIAGQSWGVVYGLGLWGAKFAQAAGMEVAATTFWSAPAHALRLQQSLLTDVTSLTNIGLLAGAFLAMRWKHNPDPQIAALSASSWAVVLAAGIIMGYSARVALGCNVGAFFSGVSTGSVHGWVWFVAAFGGSCVGLRLRPRLLISSNAVKTAAGGSGV